MLNRLWYGDQLRREEFSGKDQQWPIGLQSSMLQFPLIKRQAYGSTMSGAVSVEKRSLLTSNEDDVVLLIGRGHGVAM